MEIIYDIYATTGVLECAATIGVFDGVHVGHQQVIRQMMDDARRLHLKSMVITFDRLPQQLFVPDFCTQLITTIDEKKFLIDNLGVDYLVVLPFNEALARLTAHDFMAQVLKQRLHVKSLRIGYDNRFGSGRTEGFDDYVAFGQELGIDVLQSKVLAIEGLAEAVSSSLIRRLITEAGDVNRASELLTRCYRLSGSVTTGEHIGTGLGFPTANVVPNSTEKLIPAAGVYAVWANIEGKISMPAMMNIGMRPTFNGHQKTLEVHILDFEGNLYGKQLSIDFVGRVRDEKRFNSPEALVEQLEKDKTLVKQVFKTLL